LVILEDLFKGRVNMEIEVKRHINTECISLGATLDWNTGLAIELDILFWTIDINILNKRIKWIPKPKRKRRIKTNGV
jgi:hypothetical protein